MKTHTIRLHPEPYAAVRSGRKTIETRLYDEKRQHIALGDQLVFESRQNPTDTMTVRVIGLLRYASFADLFMHNEPTKFGGHGVAELLTEIRRFYSVTDEADTGVIGIEFERLA